MAGVRTFDSHKSRSLGNERIGKQPLQESRRESRAFALVRTLQVKGEARFEKIIARAQSRRFAARYVERSRSLNLTRLALREGVCASREGDPAEDRLDQFDCEARADIESFVDVCARRGNENERHSFTDASTGKRSD